MNFVSFTEVRSLLLIFYFSIAQFYIEPWSVS